MFLFLEKNYFFLIFFLICWLHFDRCFLLSKLFLYFHYYLNKANFFLATLTLEITLSLNRAINNSFIFKQIKK